MLPNAAWCRLVMSCLIRAHAAGWPMPPRDAPSKGVRPPGGHRDCRGRGRCPLLGTPRALSRPYKPRTPRGRLSTRAASASAMTAAVLYRFRTRGISDPSRRRRWIRCLCFPFELQDTLKVSGHHSVGIAEPQHLARVLALFRQAIASTPPDRKDLVGRPQIHRGPQRHHIRA